MKYSVENPLLLRCNPSRVTRAYEGLFRFSPTSPSDIDDPVELSFEGVWWCIPFEDLEKMYHYAVTARLEESVVSPRFCPGVPDLLREVAIKIEESS